jgi:tetratricopeptide (TPR) repeat protein
VARMRATRFVYAGDFEAAAAAYLAVMPELARHPELPDEFWSHNAMMMIREAQGDPAAALAENDQATLCAARGTWDPAGRALLAFQKDRWHRAYLTRMLAESRTGTVKQALVAYAQAALDDYRPTGFADSIAILEAYFAALDGKPEQALAAAKRVDPAKDDDVEDLYLVVVGLEAGGDHVAADVVRTVMRRSPGVHIARAIMLRWLDLDAKGARARGFTPWHASVR